MAHDSITLFHLSDIHFGCEDAAALRWVERCIAEERPDAVAITGDLTMRARSGELRAACDWINALDVPVTVEIGNHDLPHYYLIERYRDPYRRFRAIASLIEREIDFPDLAIVPLNTAPCAQWRLNWSKGCVTRPALEQTLAAIDALPDGTRVLVTAHHPLVEVGTDGTALTRRGGEALEELARRKVLAVLSGHVHDPFDLAEQTQEGPVRMIGAGTLSRRLRTTPPSFNEIRISGASVEVIARNREHFATPEMQVAEVPADAEPPDEPPRH